MAKREIFVKKMRIRVVSLKSRTSGLLFGFALSYLFWGSLLLIRCGDVEQNPGPGEKNAEKSATSTSNMRQTRLGTATSKERASSAGNRSAMSSPAPPSSPAASQNLTLADVMLKLNGMDMSMNNKLDGVLEEVADIKGKFGMMQEEVGELRREVDSLRQENQQLKDHRDALWNKVEGLEKKTDDLEGRSKRNNLIFYGMDKQQGETNASCELRLQDLCTDRLELSETVEFDRVHRISNKPNSPLIARCSNYKDKVKILKAKNKLKGSNIFVGEDYSQSVRETRKKLNATMKTMRSEGKNVTMVFDHLFCEGKRLYLAEDGESVVERG